MTPPRRKPTPARKPRPPARGAARARPPARRAVHAHTLVVSAWEPELAPLRSLLAARGGDLPGRVSLAAAGVGVVDAAAGAATVIARLEPDAVVFVGTAGVYASAAPAHAIGEAAVAGELRLLSTAALRGDAYTPAPLVAVAGSTPALAARLRAALGAEPAPLAVVACPLAITQTEELAARIAETGAALENLEAFAVARAAAAAGVAFAAVLGVSNQVGPRAHAQWRAHHLAASRAACHVVWRALS